MSRETMLNYFFHRHSKLGMLEIALSLEGSVTLIHPGKSNMLAVLQTK